MQGVSVNGRAAGAFENAKKTAAGMPGQGERGKYSKEMFLEDFPQFSDGSKCLVPEAMLEGFVEQASDSVLPSCWGSMWRYASGLYVAHFSALYLKTYAPSSASAAQAATSADLVGAVKQALMGDTSVSYDNHAITSGTEKWGAWNATQYGQQLTTLARLVGMGGTYVI